MSSAPSPDSAGTTIIIIDALGILAPVLTRAIEFGFEREPVRVVTRTAVTASPEGPNCVAFVVAGPGQPPIEESIEALGLPVVAVLAAHDPAVAASAIRDGAIDSLALANATPAEFRRTARLLLRLGRAQAEAAATATEHTRARRVIHDISNELGTILAVAEQLLDDPAISAGTRHSAGLILTATQNVAKLRDQAPTARVAIPAPARPSPSAPAAAPKRVLVIEDQADLGRLVSLTLKARGYEVLLANGADEATRLASECGWQLDVILSDVVMEGRPTHDAVAEIRTHAGGVGIVFMSAYAPDEFLAGGAIPDDAEFLQKPFTANELAAAIKSAIPAN